MKQLSKMNLKCLKPKRIIEDIWNDEFKISLFVLIVAFMGINLPTILSGRYFQKEFLNSMLSNANSVVLDILIVLCLTTYLIKKSEKRREIMRLEEEIDNLRGWKSEEASHRIRGYINQLNKLGITKMDLSNCCLRNAHLEKVNLEKSNLVEADCRNAILNDSNLRNSECHSANFSNAEMRNANLEESDCSYAIFDDANLEGSNFHKSNLSNVSFIRASLNAMCTAYGIQAWLYGDETTPVNKQFQSTNFQEAELTASLFDDAHIKGANFRRANLHQAELTEVADGLESADFSDAIMDNKIRDCLTKINSTVNSAT